MANAFTSNEITFFEDVIEGFDPNNITAKNCKKYEPPMQEVERAGLTVRRPYEMIAEVTEGLDVSSQTKDVLELTIPSTLSESDIKNHVFKLNALELNDPSRRKRASKAAVTGLSAKLDTVVSDRVSTYGSLVATETGDFTDYDALAKGETMLMEREVSASAQRSLVLNPRMSRKQANELASRQTDNGRDLTAYERSALPGVAGFDTLKANVLTAINGSGSSGVTVSGASQNKVPAAFTGSNSDAADIRYQTLTVSASHGLVAGDAFTIAGVNAVGNITKKDTGQLQTFRVISVSTNDLTISPAIVPADGSGFQLKYANVTTTPANSAAITVLNTNTAQPSIFFCEDAVEIMHGKLATAELGPTVSVMREQTDSGIEVIFAREGSINDLSATYRLSFWASANVLCPEKAGIYLPNQAAAFG